MGKENQIFSHMAAALIFGGEYWARTNGLYDVSVAL